MPPGVADKIGPTDQRFEDRVGRVFVACFAELRTKAIGICGVFQIGKGRNDVTEARALPFDKRGDVLEHAIRLRLEVSRIRRASCLADTRGPGGVERDLVRLYDLPSRERSQPRTAELR